MASESSSVSLQEPVEVGEYLFRRLHEVGLGSVHGVPGDFNLLLLDYIPKTGLKWVGNCNELNAAYAADGYARVNGIGALITTFGVGELSALAGVGGSYSEYVPVVHIVGTPNTKSQESGALLHHTLGNGNFNVFAEMSSEISCALVKLKHPLEIADQIDYAIRECFIKSRPIYISLPTDRVRTKIEGARLKTPIDIGFPPNDPEAEDYCVDVVLKYLHSAKNPVILVDACAIRHRALEETKAFIKASGLPVFVTPMGKSAIDESIPSYGGVYAGDGSNAGVRERVESSDLVLSIGAIKSDFNTTGFSYKLSQLDTIDFHSNYIRVRFSEYPGVRMNGVLKKVTERLGKVNIEPGPKPSNDPPKGSEEGPKITHKWLWPRLGQWLQPGDVVVTETGTANFGILETKFPKDVTAISQVLWGSIGYSVGACQGAALAAKEKGTRRTVLIVGDGSFQLTAQEVSTMIRHNLKVTILLINNDGYTIERLIHGMNDPYNDVQNWQYTKLLEVFGAKEAKTYQAKTKTELNDLFNNEAFSSYPSVQMAEIFMDKEDAPEVLKKTAAASAKLNCT